MRKSICERIQAGGVIPATPLVLDENRKLDEARQRRLLRYYLQAGVDGLAVGVHTTQFAIRDPHIALLEPVLRIASEEMEAFERRTGRTLIRIAGACGPTEQAEGEAALARSLGYDALLLSPSGLGTWTEEALLERTRRVAEISPVVGFYLQPSAGGRVLSYNYWTELCAVPGVAAIKCAGFDRYRMLDVARAIAMSGRAGQIALYTGNDDNIVADLLTTFVFSEDGSERKVGVAGGLLGHWAVWTRRAVEIFIQARQAKESEAIPASLLTLAAQVTDANAAFFDVAHGFRGSIAGVHEVLRRQGLMRGIWCLDPNETLSLGQANEIDRIYRMYPHLNDDAFVEQFLRDYDPA
ncbi:dihydrodipicolinate synthetase [Clostridia bacterium]|nr:dihydrodipicolinate synthetase [Clostridia bacterium]